MASPEWTEIRRLFEEALEVEPEELSDWLSEACGDDAALRREVEELLALDATDSHTPLVLEGGAVAGPGRGGESMVGARVGAFHIRRVIGVGGMGTVFEAEQERPRRTVALKMLRYAFGGERSRRRFEYEAEILGRLHHPGIAQVYEAGTWSQGGVEQPYFALEIVPGARPLDVYVRETGLGRDAVLELVGRICDAVHYGHQKGVIHRDLKPANVLVDEEGQPKVIDFGIARVTDVDQERVTLRTETGQIVGTLAYMSPEQFETDSDSLDIRVDVYALGVILFELLTGRLPYDFSGVPLAVATDMLRKGPVPRPSASLEEGRPAIPGDLDWIVLRAMEPDPARRYASASEFEADLQRFRRGEPVLAGPPSTAYRIRKFVQRNRIAVSAAVAVLAALIIGSITTAIGWSRAVMAEEVAEKRRASAEEMAETLWKVTGLQVAILGGARGDQTVKFVDVIDRAWARFQNVRLEDPNVAAALHNSLGMSYSNLGMPQRAMERYDEALRLLREAEHPMRRLEIGIGNNVGALLMRHGRLEQAETMLRDSLQGHIELDGDTSFNTANVRINLASVLNERGKFAEALEHYEIALPILELTRSANDVDTLKALAGHGNALASAGRTARAREVLTDAWQRARDHLGKEDVDTLSAQNSLAAFLTDLGEHAEAEKHLHELVDARSRILAEGHPSTLRALNNLAVCLERQGKYSEAVDIYHRVLELRRRAGGGEALFDLVTRFNLGVALHFQDGPEELAEANAVFEALLPDAEKQLPAENWRLAVFREHHGICLRKLGRYDEAEAALARALKVLEAGLGAGHSRTQSCYRELAELYDAWGKPEEAAAWREKLASKDG